VRGKAEAGGRHRHGPFGNHDRIVRRWTSRYAAEVVRGGKDLQRARDVEQLHIPEGQNLDPTRLWRKARGLWHIRQIMMR
jgi:hypothetical protein